MLAAPPVSVHNTRWPSLQCSQKHGSQQLSCRRQHSTCTRPHTVLLCCFPTPPQAGRREGDASIGRYLADTLAVVPHLDVAEFERMFNEGVQDNLLLSYFAHLVRSQVALAERLGTQALPLL